MQQHQQQKQCMAYSPALNSMLREDLSLSHAKQRVARDLCSASTLPRILQQQQQQQQQRSQTLQQL
jgi:hypothetical protein